MEAIYFDYNSTSPLRRAAMEAWCECQEKFWQNASSPHQAGARVRNQLEEARQRLGALLGLEPGRIVFTSGATEANNMVIRHWLQEGRIAISAVEHPSVREPAMLSEESRCHVLEVTPEGVLDVQAFLRLLDKSPRLRGVSVMAANNESGVLQPWSQVSRICRERGIPCHVDAVQWIGRMSLEDWQGVDFISGSGHKFGGPKGVGFLVIPRDDNRPTPLLKGGAQESGIRGGTEDPAGILAMVAALGEALAEGPEKWRQQAAFRDHFEQEMKQHFSDLRVAGETVDRLPNTSFLIMPRHANSRWIARLGKKGLMLSSGSACAAGKEGPSHVLQAQGFTPPEAGRSLRISSGPGNTAKDWQQLLEAFLEVKEELEGKENGGLSNVIEI